MKKSYIMLGVGLIILITVGLLVAMPMLSRGFHLQLFIEDSSGNKIPLSWLVGGRNAENVGVDYTFSTEGPVDQVQIKWAVYEVVFSGSPDSPEIDYVKLSGSDRTDSFLDSLVAYSGSTAWHLDTYFSSFKDGEVHSFFIHGAATAYYEGEALNTLEADTTHFTLQWDLGGLTGFTITIR